jgi:hypothetical protein
MKNIRLITPAQDKDEDPAVELDPGILGNWLNNLSSNDIIETVAGLDRALSAFNELNMSAARRLKLLEVYFVAFQKLLQGFDEMRLAQLNVSTKQKQQLRHDIVWLYIKLSHGYKIIVKEELESPESVIKPQELLLTTFRALEQTVISLLYAYRYGLDMPPLIYLELHQLYAFAEYKEITENPVKAVKGYAKKPTIASFYALALVFTSIDPTQYESHTLEVLFLALQPYLFNCRFSQLAKPEDDSFIYKINIYADSAPIMLHSGQPVPTSDDTFYLDIGNFFIEISSWLESNKNSKNTFLIEDELELFPRVLAQLSAIKDNHVSPIAEAGESPTEVKAVKLIFGLQALEGILITKSIGLDIKLDFKTSEWDIATESSAYYELTCHLADFDEPLTLGDLVSIVDCDDDGQLKALKQLAHISSMQQREDGKLLIRLEFIAGTPQPITYVMNNDNSAIEGAAQYNGIYLTAKEGGDDYQVLIASRSHVNQSQQFLLKTRTSSLNVSVIETLKETPCYACLKIEILEEHNYGLDGYTITSLAS